ncbi:MAG: hypothetical protein V1725_07395 [archaeon]
MGELPALPAPITIRYSGIFDLTGLYNLIRTYLGNNKYDIKEEIYKDKPYSTVGNEIEIELLGKAKIDAYFRHRFLIKIHTYEGKHIEVQKGTQKIKMYKGRIEISLNGKVDVDYNEQFEKYSPALKKLLFSHILKKEIELKHQDFLRKQIYAFAEDIKKFLKFDAE